MKISEEAAYLRLQRESRERRKSMREVAEATLLIISLCDCDEPKTIADFTKFRRTAGTI